MTSMAGGGSQTLARGLDVLEVVVTADRPLTLADVSERASLNRSVVYRLLRTLEDRALVTQQSGRGYEPGPGLLRLTGRSWTGLVSRARPVLRRLAEASGTTAVLTVADHGHEVCLACVLPPTDGPAITFREGASDRLGRGASSMALLALQPPVPDERPEVTAARRDGPLSVVRTAGELRRGAAGLAVAVRGWTDFALAAVFFDGTADEPMVEQALVAAAGELAVVLR